MINNKLADKVKRRHRLNFDNLGGKFSVLHSFWLTISAGLSTKLILSVRDTF